MGFETIEQPDKEYKIVKQHLLNKEGFSSKYVISDSGKSTPFYFMCPCCKESSINIDKNNAKVFDNKRINIDLDSIVELGGTGTICKIIRCSKCNTDYFIGIGYIEPNNGRDVLLIHTIIEISD